ncbi:hypothetical protein L1987_57868 [Smallanthus sonchifolius]|uniref:Uncharacterized protein n=1 Tax=Smallanthus sonchifolius TaxID=185202 RepID=A0ACB9DER0_9ASTR|nr:hypothetical protein L1987_57868 [Smallanthus sonchifolius]
MDPLVVATVVVVEEVTEVVEAEVMVVEVELVVEDTVVIHKIEVNTSIKTLSVMLFLEMKKFSLHNRVKLGRKIGSASFVTSTIGLWCDFVVYVMTFWTMHKLVCSCSIWFQGNQG